MSSDFAVRVSGLSKCYHIYEQPRDRLLQMLFRGRKKYYREFWALRDITIEIGRGQTVGIIGQNGSGKSTLLQLICGTLNPSAGSIETTGRVAALLELGAGFHPEFSGRENVYLSACVYGLKPEEVDARFDRIASFADIGDFMDQPVKTYSSGMFVRLAFSVIAHVDADILVIDEALAVGDAFFNLRCMQFLRRFRETGTLIFVSHDTGAVLSLCTDALWLDKGCLRSRGGAKQVVDAYLRDVAERVLTDKREASNRPSPGEKDRSAMDPPRGKEQITKNQQHVQGRNDVSRMDVWPFDPDAESFGSGDAKITEILLTDEQDTVLAWVSGGERVRFHVLIKAHTKIERAIVGLFIRDRLGQCLFGDTTDAWSTSDPMNISGGAEMEVVFEMVMPFLPRGSYTVSAAVAEGALTGHIQHHYFNEAMAFDCHTSTIRFGLVGIIPERVFWRPIEATGVTR